MDSFEKLAAPEPSRSGRQFFFFFLWTSIVPLILLFVAGHYTTAYLLEKEAFSRHEALAEQKHSELALFIEKLQAYTAAWGTDGRIRELAEKISDGACKKFQQATCPVAIELSIYLKENKLPLNSIVGIIDILNTDGVVVASSDMARIGIDESSQDNAFYIAKTIPFGQATFFNELVSEEEEFDGRMMVHLSAPIATMDGKRLSGVLLAHTENKELNIIVSHNRGATTESYIVNKNKLMVTPSRFIPDAVLKQEVNTRPVNECIEHAHAFTGNYKDYRGIEVFGSSVCDPNLFGTLLVETDKAEIFVEINKLRTTAAAVLLVVLILILGYAVLFRRDMIQSARHIFPSSLSSALTLSLVIGIIVAAGVGISFIFSQNIQKFIFDQKIGVISRLVSQQALRHINSSPISAFDTWETPESQKKFKDFNDEIQHSFDSVRAVQLHSKEGVLVWSSLQNAKIGDSDEAEEVAETIAAGENRSEAMPSTIEELGIETLLGVYVPIEGAQGNIVGVAETYLDIGDIALFTQTIQRVLWAGTFTTLVFTFLLLRYVFRKQDARIVAQSEELSGVIDGSPIGIYTIMKDGTIGTFNPAMTHEAEIHNTGELPGKNVFSIEYYRTSGLDKSIKEGLTGITFKKEVAFTDTSNKKFYHFYYGVPLKNTDGEIDQLLLMSEDITERKELENKVREYTKGIEGEYQALLASLDDSALVTITDEKGDITYANKKFCEISRYPIEEMIGQNHRILKSGHQPQEIFIDMWKTISSGKVWRGEIKNRAKDGTYYWVDGTIVPILGDNGKPKNYVAIRILITDRKELEERTEEYLRNTEEERVKAEALLASLGEGMIATDNETKIITMNPAAERMLGWTEPEVIGKKLTDVITAEYEDGEVVPLDKRAITTTIITGEMTHNESMQFVSKNGRRIPVAVTISPVIINRKLSGTVSIFRDITDERELEKTRRDLLSLASHQLRTPLSGTKWLIETLRKGIHGSLTKTQEEYLDEIYKINERMTTLVHDMLGVLRMEGDINPAKKEVVSIPTLLGVVFESLSSAAKSKNISLHTEIGDIAETETDPFLLQHILESLVANAINYSPAHSEVIVTVTKNNNELTFLVKDSGIGIPVDEQRQIFQRFYRASNAKTYDTHGSGLGLYIAATLAKKIGAKLNFESEKDKGSTFFVHIPILKQ